MNEDLQDWLSANEPPDEMYYKNGYWAQGIWVRNTLGPLVCTGLGYEQERSWVKVVSTHRSKSVVLPVYRITRPDLGLTVTLRNNFYDWKLSVETKEPLEVDFGDLLHTTPPVDPEYTGDPLHAVYFEGFKVEWVYGYYEQNKAQWSAWIHTNEALYCTIWLIMKALGAIKHPVWAARKIKP